MSSAQQACTSDASHTVMQADTLLEHLYTYFTLEQLHEMRDARPNSEMLKTWDVLPEAYIAQVKIAIEYVMRD